MTYEEGLIKEFLNGNKKAFEELVNMFYPDVYRLCCFYINDRNESYDITQEVFILVYKNLKNFRGDAPFKIWLFKIAYNKCMEFLRKNSKNIKEIHFQNEENDQTDTLENFAIEKSENVTSNLKPLITSTLNCLPDRTRHIVELFYYMNFSCSEIAQLLDMSEGAVKTALCRARNTLKEKLRTLQK